MSVRTLNVFNELIAYSVTSIYVLIECVTSSNYIEYEIKVHKRSENIWNDKY